MQLGEPWSREQIEMDTWSGSTGLTSSLTLPLAQAYVTSHVSTAIYVLDFLKRTKARGAERDVVELEILALMRLQKQVGK